MIFSNLEQKNAFPRFYDHYLKTIKDLTGIVLPGEVLSLLYYDKANNTGNFEKTFTI